jgi:solute carrier family 34 (sodium-dependent phosphate cotransporter)
MKKLLTIMKRLGCVVLGIWLVLAAIESLKRGTSAISFLFETVVDGWPSALGIGWFSACVLLSGSPAAALALTFMGEGSIDRRETLAMIAGSRLGSCFVVLAVGLLHDYRSKARGRTSYIGVAGLIVTASVILPALGVGLRLLESDALCAALRVNLSGATLKLLDPLLVPIRAVLEFLPWPIVQFGLGVAFLLGAFKVFDWALPDISASGDKISPLSHALYRPPVMFGLGLLVTAITMSVSVSLTVLVPLTARGYVRRENLFPYMIGANVTTFIDTLFVALLVPASDAFATVFVLMMAVTAVAVPIVFLAAAPYAQLVDRWTVAVSREKGRERVFVAALFLIPLALILSAKVFES